MNNTRRDFLKTTGLTTAAFGFPTIIPSTALGNAGPPTGFRERGEARGRRATSVQEIALSERQWERYFSQSQPMPIATIAHGGIDEASMVLARVRD